MPIKVGMVSLGCPKNQVDAELLLHKIKQDGYCLLYTSLSGALLYLKVATRSEWVSEKVSSDYELIDTRGQIVYLAKIPDSDSDLKISIPQVKEYFSRII